jgi:hypothetical protein
MRRAAAFAPFALAGLAAGCSFTGLSDYEIFTCDAHPQCEPLNEREGIAEDACVRYQCATDGRCRLQPRDRDRDGHADAACAGSDGCDALPCDDCDDGAAAAHPGLDEVCDGLDNDCDLVVDDVPAGAAPAAAETVVANTGALSWHAFGAPLEGSPVSAIAFGRPGAAFFQVPGRDDDVEPREVAFAAANVDQLADPSIVRGCPNDDVRAPPPPTGAGPGVTADTCQDHADCSDGVFCNGFERCEPTAPDADANGCRPAPDGSPCADGSRCDEAAGVCELSPSLGVSSCALADLVTAELDESVWFGAGVQQTACGGLLRVGYLTEGMGDGETDPGRALLLRGDHRRSTSYRGIDPISPAGMGDCTGRSRPADEPLGVASPAIAALPAAPERGRRRPQALVAWLVPTEGRGRPVEVLGVWQERFTAGGTPVHWVNATGDAAPQRLEAPAAGDARPALVSVAGASSAGYLLGYGAAEGGLALRFVPAFADPPEVIDAAPHTTPIGPGETEPRATAPLAELGAPVRLPTDGVARHVAVAVGRRRGGVAQLGVAWVDDAGVRFATPTLDPTTGTIEGFEPRTVGGDAATELALAHTPRGLLLPGYAHQGQVADATSTGGFLLAWRTEAGVYGARFSDLSGLRLPPETMRLGPGAWERLRVAPGTDPEGRRGASLLFHDPGPRELRRLPTFCGP